MREFFEIVFSFDMKRIFYSPTQNVILQFARYAFVGALATFADWASMYIFAEWGKIHYLISTVMAFVIGLAINFILSKKFVFSAEKKQYSSSTEFAVYAIIGLIGLAMTEGIMYLLVDTFKFYFMIPKIIATAVVFVWNFAARKLALYR